jgi:glycosyltransferase involved in cell wall biosynthesis
MTKYSVSYVLPMYNEAANIEDMLNRLSAIAKDICDDYEIVVADDASTDGCQDMAQALADTDPHIKCVRLEKNTKFGGALAAGLKAASKEVIVYTDSDLPVKEEDMKKALELLDGADIVTGYSLAIKDASLKRIVMSKVYNFLVGLLFGLKIRDINSGFKIYKRKAVEGLDLKSKSPFVDVEIFAEAAKRGFKVSQYGLVFELRTKGRSTISRPGIVARTFYDMIKYRIGL